MPHCSPDGSYEQIQCTGGVCYCVTPEGKEIPGTKIVNSARQPNCTHPGNPLEFFLNFGKSSNVTENDTSFLIFT